MKKKIALAFCLLISVVSHGFELDHKVEKDDGGFWGSHYDVPKYSAIFVLGMAAYEGTESRIGKASYQSLEAGLMSQLITEGLKKATGRNRPREADGPNEWNEGGASFPSGHVSGMTALVTPYIFEYQEDYPIVHALWLLPLYQMIGRVKAQAHWQTDVIAGALVGLGSGYWAYQRETPLLLYFDEDKVVVGLKHAF